MVKEDLLKETFRPSTALGYIAMALESRIISDRLGDLVLIDFQRSDKVRLCPIVKESRVKRHFHPRFQRLSRLAWSICLSSLGSMDC